MARVVRVVVVAVSLSMSTVLHVVRRTIAVMVTAKVIQWATDVGICIRPCCIV